MAQSLTQRVRPLVGAETIEEAMSSPGRLASFLRDNRGEYLCDACVALEIGTSLLEARAALLELRDDGVVTRQASECSRCGRPTEVTAVKS
jgi:hypothetical protein